MKHFLSILILSTGLSSFAQSDSLLIDVPWWTGNDCELGENMAITDTGNGIYKVYSFGLIMQTPEQWKFDEYYTSYLKEKYGIKMEHQGCVVYKTAECYSDKMTKLIKIKFGQDLFEKSRKEAEKLFTNQIQLKIDTGFIFNDIHFTPEFNGGIDSLHSYLNKQITYPVNKSGACVNGKTYVEFIIEKDGSVSYIKILHSLTEDIDKMVIEAMNKMPKWIPAKFGDQAVRCRLVLPINFSLSK